MASPGNQQRDQDGPDAGADFRDFLDEYEFDFPEFEDVSPDQPGSSQPQLKLCPVLGCEGKRRNHKANLTHWVRHHLPQIRMYTCPCRISCTCFYASPMQYNVRRHVDRKHKAEFTSEDELNRATRKSALKVAVYHNEHYMPPGDTPCPSADEILAYYHSEMLEPIEYQCARSLIKVEPKDDAVRASSSTATATQSKAPSQAPSAEEDMEVRVEVPPLLLEAQRTVEVAEQDTVIVRVLNTPADAVATLQAIPDVQVQAAALPQPLEITSGFEQAQAYQQAALWIDEAQSAQPPQREHCYKQANLWVCMGNNASTVAVGNVLARDPRIAELERDLETSRGQVRDLENRAAEATHRAISAEQKMEALLKILKP